MFNLLYRLNYAKLFSERIGKRKGKHTMQKQLESWKDIKGYNNYEISNTGRIRNKKRGTEVKGRPTPKGYLQVRLSNNNIKKNKYIHRLVMLSFDYTKEHDELEVNHKDFNKSNNNINNLEWLTGRENIDHYYKNKILSNPPLV